MIRLCSVFGVTLTLALSTQAAEPPEIKLWPDKAPGETKELTERYIEAKKADDVKRLTDVSVPTIAIYAPTKEKANGTSIIVAPGGGYSILAIEHEGTQVCEWLNTLGVTAVLLKYRVPKRAMQMPENLASLQDAQRAVSIVRSKASELNLDPNRIGFLGFSAGGNLAAWTLLTKKRMYDNVDAVDEKYSHEPNFGVLVYPAYIVDKAGALKPEFEITKNSPPMFFAHSSDDPVTSEASTALYMALKKNNVPAELHLYANGGHGWGMKKVPHPCATWPNRAGDWLKTRGLLEKAKSKE